MGVIKSWSRLGSIVGLLLLNFSFSGMVADHHKAGTPTQSLEVKKASSSVDLAFNAYADSLYRTAGLEASGLSKEAFNQAITGYYNIKMSEANRLKLPILSVIDFTMKSTERRLWVIDLSHGRLLYHVHVAHGKNSGELYAEHFSNQPSSDMSSLGFYLTAEIYDGKHGRSLALDGLEKGFNDHARERAIVMHSADYVSEDFIKNAGRLGRSWGCPAISTEMAPEIINTIANGSCLFIYYPDKNYAQSSALLNLNTAELAFQKVHTGRYTMNN